MKIKKTQMNIKNKEIKKQNKNKKWNKMNNNVHLIIRRKKKIGKKR